MVTSDSFDRFDGPCHGSRVGVNDPETSTVADSDSLVHGRRLQLLLDSVRFWVVSISQGL